MLLYSNQRVRMCTKPLKPAVFYDFYMFVQMFGLVLFAVGAGRLAFFIDRTIGRDAFTPPITRCLEAIASFSVGRR